MYQPDIPHNPNRDNADMPQRLTVFYESSQNPSIDPSYLNDFGFDLSVYRMEDHQIKVNDAVWGEELFSEEQGDHLTLELAVHSVMARLQAIEQLTSPPYMTTIAGMSGMPRWDHAWGTLILARRFGKMLSLSPEQSRQKQVRALLSDASQWSFSHLGDFMLQGMGGSEDAHDMEQLRFLTAVGVGELVARYDLDLEDLLVASDAAPWEECPKPNLNIDNLDYISRQALRMFSGVAELEDGIKRFPFEINDGGNIVITDVKVARMLTKAAMLLPTEHWQEPTHRLQLMLLQEMVRHDIVRYGPRAMQFYAEGQALNPRDALMTVDYDFEASAHTSSPLLWALYDIAKQVGTERRTIFRSMRQATLNRFVADEYPMELPDPLVGYGPHSARHSVFPSNLEIIEVADAVDVADYGENSHTVDFFLPALKRRYIDPLVRLPDGSEGPLSQTKGNADIGELIERQAEILKRTYVARLLVNPDYKQIIETAIKENMGYWTEQLNNPLMKAETFARCFEDIAGLAKVARKSQIDWRR